ncbi:MAG TPA: TonB-dependent receptor [Bryobacteraceae bacterium]|nr:TonB-dependent receptor [Bryobacteraceae bacterium]
MKSFLTIVCLLVCSAGAFAQDRGTITGTISDPAGAVISNASVEARNLETGVTYPVVSTSTGNYTVTQLPVGQYEVTATVPGFKKFTRSGITVAVNNVLRIDIALEVGQATESVTVNAEASLLKTETADLAHNVNVEQLDNLPILGIGNSNAGSSGIRNPYGLALLVPGTVYAANFSMVVNGAPSNTAGYRIEGQDMTNHFVSFALQEMQPSADAIQEVAVQTSNYAPEFGTAGGGLFNITMKSGTNQFHGSGYDYFVDEFLNAGYPFSDDGTGHKVRPRNRRNDYGGTLGGPVFIPKLYNGRDKTFFFFNWEEFLESTTLPFNLTVPTLAYRQGDFSSISANGNAAAAQALGVPITPLPSTDPLGRPIFANTIYNPFSERTIQGGAVVRDPFDGNKIPGNLISPFAQKVQSLIPNPANSNFVGNAFGSNLSRRTTVIPSLKLDQAVGSKGRLSFYWSQTQTDSQYSFPNGNADGLPDEISGARGTFFHYWVTRLNYDHTLTPTILLHLGAGYNQIYAPDTAPFTTFNAQQAIGVSGFQANRNFPYVSGMCAAPPPGATGCGGGLGGMQPIGTSNGIQSAPYQQKPSGNVSATWVHGNHAYKIGGEVYFQGAISHNFPAVLLAATSSLSQGATALPFTPSNGLGGQQIGFGYANFLLGDFVTLQQNREAEYRVGKSQWATFVQDSWKATRKLTVDYGVRWDYGTYGREQYGRAANFSPTVVNPSAGGRLGGTIFEATCDCQFADNYPYAIGPRLGIAYQITPKTVLRAGWGVVYGFTADVAGSAATSAINGTNAPGAYINVLDPGALPQPQWPVYNPGLYPQVGTVSSAPQALDRNAGRPPRQNQWSIGLQREISTNLVVEAAYVGNRGVWWSSSGIGFGANLGLLDQVSPATFAAHGLDPYHSPTDNLLLSQPINSPAVIARVGNVSPYPGFPANQTLLNALRPYPQFSAVAGGFGPPGPLQVSNAPTGDTWYDSLQAKVTKRFSHGLSATGTFTWSKSLISTRENFWDPASSSKTLQTTDQPFLFNANILYTVPSFFTNHALSWATRDWQVGAFLQYASGFPLTPPISVQPNNLTANNGTTASTPIYQIRVADQPLYNKNPNCGCINPYYDQVLNPLAWTNPLPGTFGTNALYGDFRGPRRPQENLNFGRNFRFKERLNLQIRAEFVNIFNRTYLGNPSTTLNLGNPLTRSGGLLTGGFGVINDVVARGAIPGTPSNGNFNTALGGLPRTGTLIARFTF